MHGRIVEALLIALLAGVPATAQAGWREDASQFDQNRLARLSEAELGMELLMQNTQSRGQAFDRDRRNHIFERKMGGGERHPQHGFAAYQQHHHALCLGFIREIFGVA